MKRDHTPEEYNQHFREESDYIKAGPVDDEDRKCRDLVCFFIFVLMVVATGVIGAIMIVNGHNFYDEFDISVTGIGYMATIFAKHGGLIIGMFFLALVLAIIFLLLLKSFPKCMVYSIIGLTIATLVVLIVIGAVNQIWWMVGVYAITLAFTICMLCCYWSRIKTGVMLLQVATEFLREKPTTYVAPIYPLIFGVMFFVFWVIAMLSNVYSMFKKRDNG